MAFMAATTSSKERSISSALAVMRAAMESALRRLASDGSSSWVAASSTSVLAAAPRALSRAMKLAIRIRSPGSTAIIPPPARVIGGWLAMTLRSKTVTRATASAPHHITARIRPAQGIHRPAPRTISSRPWGEAATGRSDDFLTLSLISNS